MKLNKSERHTAYIIMLWEIENNFYESCAGRGFCWLISDLLDIEAYVQKDFKQGLPELYKKNPGTYQKNIMWFMGDKSGWQKRIELLKQCVKETY